MVLGRGNKNSPAREVRPQDTSLSPPPYDEKTYASPIVLAETTRTTRTKVVTTTTQTTTHFFSLPLWRRRQAATTSSSARQSISEIDEFGFTRETASPSTLLIDKALPPTPTTSQETPMHEEEILPQGNQMMDGTANIVAPANTVSPSKSTPSRRKTTRRGQPNPNPNPPPTLALAKASLRLGLTNIIPVPPTPSSSPSPSSDVNTVAFATSSAQVQPQYIRRAKSSQKLGVTRSSDDHAVALRKSLDFGEWMRSRGDSMNGQVTQSSDKGKGKDMDDTPVQSLSRRPSFWSRKKKDGVQPQTVPERNVRPSLPSVLPGSPFNIDVGPTPFNSSSASQDHHGSPRAQSLSRSISENVYPHSPASLRLFDTNSSHPLPSPKQTPCSPRHRPATADPSLQFPARLELARPTTSHASSLTPAVRFFSVDPSSSRRPITSSPTSLYQDTHSQESSFPTRRRPRSQTNPPLLHRLSVNLFSPGPASMPKTSGVFSPNVFTSSTTPASDSPRPSISRPSVEVPKPQMDEESPDAYLERLLNLVSKADIAGVLASR